MKTKTDMTIRKGAYAAMQYEIKIPAGSPVHKSNGEYWLNPSMFEGIDRHDAKYYGFRVNADNVIA